MRKIKIFLVVLLILAALGAAAVAFLPWSVWAGIAIKGQLTAAGFTDVDVTVESVSYDRSVAKNFKATRGDIKLSVAEAIADYRIHTDKNPYTVDGNWEIRDLAVTGTASDPPPLSGKGTASYQGIAWHFEGRLASADKKHHVEFKAVVDHKIPDESKLTIISAAIPWHDGTVFTRNATLALSGPPRFKANLEAKGISLKELLQLLTDNRASATGTVSGSAPVSGTSLDDIVVRGGKFVSDAPGTISLAPDALPGDSRQLDVVRNVLGNFHYKHLILTLETDDKGKLAMALALEGNNPDAYDGRPVKLNVQLTGDVLSLLRQSILPLTNPEQWIKNDEKN